MQWFSNCSQWSIWIRISWDLVKNANYLDACQAYKNKYLEGTIINQPAWPKCLRWTRDLWVLGRECCFLSHCCHAFSAFQKTSGGDIGDLGWLGNLNPKRKRPQVGQGEKKTQQPCHASDSAFSFVPSARASESQGAGSGRNLYWPSSPHCGKPQDQNKSLPSSCRSEQIRSFKCIESKVDA